MPYCCVMIAEIALLPQTAGGDRLLFPEAVVSRIPQLYGSVVLRPRLLHASSELSIGSGTFRWTDGYLQRYISLGVDRQAGEASHLHGNTTLFAHQKVKLWGLMRPRNAV